MNCIKLFYITTLVTTMDQSVVYKAIKYLMFLVILIFSLRIVPQNKLNYTEILIISALGIISFTLLDIYIPSVVEKGEHTS